MQKLGFSAFSKLVLYLQSSGFIEWFVCTFPQLQQATGRYRAFYQSEEKLIKREEVLSIIEKSSINFWTKIAWNFWESCWKVAENSNSKRLKILRSCGKVAKNYNSNRLKLLRKLRKSCGKVKLKSAETFEKFVEKLRISET